MKFVGVWFWLAILAAAVGGWVFGRTVGHPGDPPHVFTAAGLLPPMLLLAGVFPVGGREDRSGCWVSAGLAAYCVIAVGSEPFLDFRGGTLTGLLPPLTWLTIAAVVGRWLAGRRRWLSAAGACAFVAAGLALMGFNMRWADPAGFVSIIRT